VRNKKHSRLHMDDEQEALRLFRKGYRQTSRRHGIVSRVEVPDVFEALSEKLPHSQVQKWERWRAEDHWRRCYSQDQLEDVPEGVMRALRRFVEEVTTRGGLGFMVPEDSQTDFDTVVAQCVDNTGLEEFFDRGIEYVVERVEKDMIAVFDKFGKIRDCFRPRFRMVS